MKVSKYNFIFPSGNRFILYNSVSDYMTQIESRLMDVYNQNEKDPDKINNIAPDFYQFLCDKGFLVNNEADETEDIITRWKEEDSSGQKLQITVNPTLNCNLNCWYCYEKHGKESRMSSQTQEALLLFLKNNVRKYQEIVISFFGGEPLLCYDDIIKPLLERIKEIQSDTQTVFSIHITTNATLLTPTMIDFFARWNTSFQITIDGNEFLHNLVKNLPDRSVSSYRIIINNIRKLLQQKLYVGIRFNYTAKTLPRFIDVLSDINHWTDEEKKYANISFHRIWQDNKVPFEEIKPVLSDAEEKCRQIGFYVNSHTSNTVRRCYADKDSSFVVNYDGSIYKCTARDFTEENKEGELLLDGSIAWNERYKKRQAVMYGKKECKNCIIFSLCRGGCSQSILENNNFSCIKGFSEEDKIKFIQQRILDIYKERHK